MKSIFLILFLLGALFMQVFGQTRFGSIEFVGCGDVMENNYYGKTLYAIKDQQGTKPFGRVVFTPQEGGHPWTFSWTYNGIPQPVNPGDTISLTVDIPGDGLLTFRAEKDGIVSVSAPDFHVFYDHVPEFSIRLSDIFNCVAITIDEITDFQIPYYNSLMEPEHPSYQGDKSIYYLISGRTTPISYDNYEYAFKPKEGFVTVTSEDREASVTITDKFGFEWISKPAKYTSCIPEAKAELKLLNNVDIVGEVNAEMGQAPLDVEFYNNSYNAGSYEWLLYKDTSDMKEPVADVLDSLINGQIRRELEFTYTYEHTGRYKVRLIAINDKGNKCQDTTEAMYINVIESLVDVANVFTPNGDGKNDIFKVKALSVENFQAVILNRWGRKVHEWTNPQDGWDGRIHGKYATPGTYFYIVTARGREKNSPPKYVKKGALLLVR